MAQQNGLNKQLAATCLASGRLDVEDPQRIQLLIQVSTSFHQFLLPTNLLKNVCGKAKEFKWDPRHNNNKKLKRDSSVIFKTIQLFML